MTEQPASPLVLTKLRVPSAWKQMVQRARLVDLLTTEIHAPFVLVCAPAGYGKTTLLTAWAHRLLQNGAAVAWYALDPGDDEAIPFGAYLTASFIQALGPIPELTLAAERLRASPEIDLQRILPALINAVVSSGRDCVLILDDYHLITSPAVHSAISYLLEHIPENLRLAIGSRSDPPLTLARLRALGRMHEVRAAALRFNADETRQFLNEVMRLELSPEGVAALEERTEGWVAGLQLAALSLSGRADKESYLTSFSGSHRYLVEYLMEEVVQRQTEDVQNFLLSTSILERQCAPLCDAILRQTGQSEAILELLEQANLFVVALDDLGVWYRYHHLFRDFLRARLMKTRPGQAPALHRAACEWLAANGFLREAAGHALQTQDWVYAAAFVEQHGFTLIVHSEIATLYEWCSAFPETVMQEHPMLCVLQGLALAYHFQGKNRARILARLQQVDPLIAALEDPDMARGLTDMASVVRTFMAMAPDRALDARELLDLAKSMMESYPEGNAGRFSGLLTRGYALMALHDAQAAAQVFETARQMALREHLYFGVVESSFHLARLAYHQGQLGRAAVVCRQATEDVEALLANDMPARAAAIEAAAPPLEQGLPALGSLDVALGCVLLEQDRLEKAEQHLLHGLAQMGWSMNPYYLMTGYTALYRLREIQGRQAEAQAALSQLEEAWPDIAFCTSGLRLLHGLRAEPVDPGWKVEAAQWLQSFPGPSRDDSIPPGLGPIGAAEAYSLAYLAWARVQIALGNPGAARPYLAKQTELARSYGLTTRVIELSLLDSLASQAEGNTERAWEMLERALRLGQPEGYVRIFDLGPGLTRLLAEMAGRGNHPAYIERILAAIDQPPDDRLTAPGAAARPGFDPGCCQSAGEALPERLSERELEVLRLMAHGATNQAIADQLVITVGTVKSHINHILGKLDAHNRTEAVARARDLGLLKI